MKVYTTLPGVQFYAGNFIAPEEGKAGAAYDNRSGFALETQYYPDTIHHENFLLISLVGKMVIMIL